MEIATLVVILAVDNTKGGVGKTTIAVNLAILRAVAGRDGLLVDGDEQGSASLFSQLRADLVGACGYTAVELHGALRTQVRQVATKYGDIIIDVGGRDTGSLRAALTVADVVLVPVQPRSFNVWQRAASSSAAPTLCQTSTAIPARLARWGASSSGRSASARPRTAALSASQWASAGASGMRQSAV
jgi:chromosome partitioning protein